LLGAARRVAWEVTGKRYGASFVIMKKFWTLVEMCTTV
jgi:hypothetical protein